MALAAVAAGAVRVGALLGRSAAGVRAVAGSTVKSGGKKLQNQVKKNILKRNRIKKETLVGKKRNTKRKQEKINAKLREQELERKNASKSGSKSGFNPKKLTNPLQALIQFISTILMGWVANKLPQIIEWAQSLIKKIQDFVEKIKSFFSNLFNFFGGIKDLIVSSFNAVVNLDFSDKEGNISAALDKIKESFGGAIKDIGDGFNILKRKEKEDPSKILKQKPGDVTNEGSYSELKPPSGGKDSSSRTSGSVSTPLTPIVLSSKSTPGGQFGESSLIAAMNRAGIVDPTERAMFLAQMAHESGNFRYDEEIASGKAYEGRSDLGNNQPGDGVRYKGRGYIQLTGRANYRYYGNLLGVDLENNPDLAKDPNIAADIAIAYWKGRVNRNAARAGDVRTVTKNINGGYNGLSDRQNKFDKYMKNNGGSAIQSSSIASSGGNVSPMTSDSSSTTMSSVSFPTSSPNIQSMPRTAQLDMDRQGQDIVVVDDQPVAQQQMGGTQQSSSKITVVSPSLNSILRQQLLLELVYT